MIPRLPLPSRLSFLPRTPGLAPAAALAALCLLLVLAPAQPPDASGPAAGDSGPAAYGRARLLEALRNAGLGLAGEHGLLLDLAVAPGDPLLGPAAGRPEGFYAAVRGRTLLVRGEDPAGVLYGCLALAEEVSRAGALPDGFALHDWPDLEWRAPCILLMKLGTYNYPLTPAEFPFFYDRAQWEDWLDDMAANRYNALAIWNGHPFAYFVHFDQYAEAQSGLDPAQIEANRQQLHWLLDAAARRHIRLFFQFYNIHTSVYFQRHHGLPDELSRPTPLLADYTRYALGRFAAEFPQAGYYITPGEALDPASAAGWVNDVLLPAIYSAGHRPPVWLREWEIPLDVGRAIAARHPELAIERKYNVEMIAGTRADPGNADWAALTGRHLVNIHMAGNLEPFRWAPPAYIRACLADARLTGATGFHLYPRKSWRWPWTSDLASPELQWSRDWLWFAAWGRYAWRDRPDAAAETAYWLDRLTRHFGSAETARHLLDSFAAGADVLPALQRLVWLGRDNHTVITAGIRLKQLEDAPGIPFLPLEDEVARIPAWLQHVRAGAPSPAPGPSPVAFTAGLVDQAARALTAAEAAAAAATRRLSEARGWAQDARLIWLTARFYAEKLRAAELRARWDVTPETNPAARSARGQDFLSQLAASVATYRELAGLAAASYESLSDVPAWHPERLPQVPYHWRDILPGLERELALYREDVALGVRPVSTLPAFPGLAGLWFGDPGLRKLKGPEFLPSLQMDWPRPDDSEDRGKAWSAEFEGLLLPSVSGSFQLRVESSHPLLLRGGGVLLIDAFGFPGVKTTAPVTWQAGQPWPLYLLLDHPAGADARASLRVSYRPAGADPGAPWEPLPDAWLRHAESHRRWVERATLLQ